jgi:hypothetical protein
VCGWWRVVLYLDGNLLASQEIGDEVFGIPNVALLLDPIGSKQMNGDDRGGAASCERNPMEQDDRAGQGRPRESSSRVSCPWIGGGQ